jgi:Flp pilus assembly pilin Flp
MRKERHLRASAARAQGLVEYGLILVLVMVVVVVVVAIAGDDLNTMFSVVASQVLAITP